MKAAIVLFLVICMIVVIISLNSCSGEKCEVIACQNTQDKGVHIGEYKLCYNCRSRIGMQARKELSVAYSLEEHGYIMSNAKIREKEIEIIERMLRKPKKGE